jgi:hypothetical protein
LRHPVTIDDGWRQREPSFSRQTSPCVESSVSCMSRHPDPILHQFQSAAASTQPVLRYKSIRVACLRCPVCLRPICELYMTCLGEPPKGYAKNSSIPSAASRLPLCFDVHEYALVTAVRLTLSIVLLHVLNQCTCLTSTLVTSVNCWSVR